MPFNKIKSNLKVIYTSAPCFIQFLYMSKVLWWGIGGILGVRFMITYLNYLVIYPFNILLIFLGLIGLIGALFNQYYLNLIFALSMVFIFSCIGLTFLQHAWETISAGTYFIDMLGTIWLTFRIQLDHAKEKRYLQFNI